MAYIYALFDPLDGIPRYIGQTKNIWVRKGRWVTSNTPWINAITDANMDLGIYELDEVPDDQANTAEQLWIKEGWRIGWPLLNKTAGGAGGLGRVDSPEVRKQRSEARLKVYRFHSEETKAKIAAKLTGKQLPESTKIKMRASHKGKAFHSEEFKKKLAERNTKRVWTAESRAKTSTSMKKKKGPDCSGPKDTLSIDGIK